MAGKPNQYSDLPTEVPDKFSEDFLKTLDGRCKVARLLKERVDELQADLGGDLSYQRRSLVKRVIHLEARIEAWETALAEGHEVPMGTYLTSLNSLVGLYRTLGMERRSKRIPALREYIEGQNES